MSISDLSLTDLPLLTPQKTQMSLFHSYPRRSSLPLVLSSAALFFTWSCSDGAVGNGPSEDGTTTNASGTGGSAISAGSGGQTMTHTPGTGATASGGYATLGSGGMAEGSGGAETSTGGEGGISEGSGGSDTQAPDEALVLQEDESGFCRVAGVIESTNAGFSGSGYANTKNFDGALISWEVSAASAGDVPLRIVYSSGAGDRTGVFSINGQALPAQTAFPATSDFTSWSELTVNVPLVQGDNLITLTAVGADGLPNVDLIELTSNGLSPVDCATSTDLPPLTIYVAGDSTVSTYTDTASPSDQAGWGQMLHEIFDDRVTVENRAMGGRTALWFHLEGGTAWVLDRIKPEDYFFIQFGTNDSHKTAEFTVDGTTYKRFADAGTTFKEHLLEYYIKPTRAKSATPVLVTPPPRNSAYCGTGNSLAAYAQAMRELGEAEDVLVLDNNQRTFNHLSEICPSPTPEDFFFIRADQTVDGTHFQENGARHMARFIGHEMNTQSAGPYSYLVD